MIENVVVLCYVLSCELYPDNITLNNDSIIEIS